MNKENINRLKKYLFLISMFFSFLIWWHIIYVYLYDNAIESPIEWWSVSEGIIWDFPHLNPLLSSNDYNKNINYMLYRSLLKYDFEKKEITWDLANCDIKNLWYIECYLKDNVLWSNGEAITSEDVVATYNIIKNSDINNSLWSLLKDTVIEQRQWAITFSNRVKDVSFLQIFFQPIVPKLVLDNIWNKELYGKFNPIDWIYSGPYKVETVSYDDALWVQKLMLTKNENYKESNILINKYIFKIFKDQAHFLKHKDLINVFYDKDNIIGDSIPRLEKKPYFLNQYMSIFINEEKVKNIDLRNFILWKIDTSNILKTLGSWYKEVSNPFLVDWISQSNEIKNTNLENIIKDSGYFKKDYLISMLNQSASWTTQTQTEQKTNSDLSYIVSPITKKYSFLNADDVLITWNIKDKAPDEIYINDYKLSSYKKWDKEFYYRLKLDYKNIHAWENNYTVLFVTSGQKEEIEKFTIIFSIDKEKLANLEKNYFGTGTQNTIEIDEVKKQKIMSLDNKYYYDKDLNKFILKLYYIENKSELLKVANTIKNNLESYWIEIEAVPITISDLNKNILAWEKNYDMILVWIDLWYFDFNIYPYFHSSQSKNWYSFSNVKNLNLDIVLEELRSNILSNDKKLELEKKLVTTLNEKQVFKALYKKENIALIDQNIKNFSLPSSIPSDLAVIDSLNKSYVTSEKKIVFEEKWVYDFIKFIKRVFSHE